MLILKIGGKFLIVNDYGLGGIKQNMLCMILEKENTDQIGKVIIILRKIMISYLQIK